MTNTDVKNSLWNGGIRWDHDLGNTLNDTHIRSIDYGAYSKKEKDMKAATIKNVIFNPPATIVFWSNGDKTVVKCDKTEEFDPEKGMAMAISKHALGNKGAYYNEFVKYAGTYSNKMLDEKFKVDVKS